MAEAILDYVGGEIRARLEKSHKTLVQNVSFTIRAGESLALIGETGSGKTMIALSILGVLPENVGQRGGRVAFCGRALRPGRTLRRLLGVEIVYIPQNGGEALNPSKKVKHHLYDSLKKMRVPGAALHRTACEKLSAAGFMETEEIMELYPFQLSGGMAQRVTIALAACSRAKLILADEPTNGLDMEAKAAFMAQLNGLFPQAAKLVITHDISVAALCDQALVLCGGKMLETGRAAALLKTPRHPYTRALLDALVENGMQETKLLRQETGFCPFYKRCPKADEQCRRQMRRQCDGQVEWWCNYDLS